MKLVDISWYDLIYTVLHLSRSGLSPQKETLSSKPKTVANIEELERLIPLLEEAKADEITAAVNKAVEKALAEERANVAAQVLPLLFAGHSCIVRKATDATCLLLRWNTKERVCL